MRNSGHYPIRGNGERQERLLKLWAVELHRPTMKTNFEDEGTPWITPADLTGYEGVYIARGKRSLSKKGLASCGARPLPAGTVLYSSRAPIGYCAIASNPLATNQGFKSLVLAEGLLPEFIRYYLLASKEYAESLASGTTFKELSGSRIAEMLIPVAPHSRPAAHRFSNWTDLPRAPRPSVRSWHAFQHWLKGKSWRYWPPPFVVMRLLTGEPPIPPYVRRQ